MENSSQELEQLRGFVLSIIDHTGLDASEADLAPIREAKNVNGMRQATRDMIEMCQDLPPDEVAKLDKRLEDLGLPTLTAMRDARYRDLLQILSRGSIASGDEFRLVESFVSDTASSGLSESLRLAASSMLAEFELEGDDSAP